MEAANPDFAEAVRTALMTMPAVKQLGFELTRIEPGAAELVQPWRAELTQHTGLFQGGVLGSLADFAAGSAAASLLPRGWVNMTIDYLVKIVAPAKGEQVIARGRVVHAGRTTTVAAAELYAVEGGVEMLTTTALATFRNLKV